MKTRRSWKHIYWLCLLSLGLCDIPAVFASQDQSLWGQSAQGFRLGLLMEKTNITIGESGRLVLILTNIDTEPHWVMKSSSFKDYQFKLINEEGETVPQKSNKVHQGGINETSQWNPPAIKTVVESGKADRIETDLNFMFDLKSPGKYQLRAMRVVPDLKALVSTNAVPAFTNLISNTIEFSLVASQLK